MKTRRTKTVSICIVIAYILSVVTYAAVLGFEFNRGTKLCQDRFASVTRAISTSLRAGEPGSKNFYDTLLSALGDMEYIASLKISEGEKPVHGPCAGHRKGSLRESGQQGAVA